MSPRSVTASAKLLLGVLIRRGHWGRDAGLLKRIPRLLAASAAMAGALYFAARWFSASLGPGAPFYEQAVVLGAMIAGAMALYFAIVFAIGGADIGMIRRSVKRGSAGVPDREE